MRVCVCVVCVWCMCVRVCVCVCVYETDDFLYVCVCIKAAWAARLDVSNVQFYAMDGLRLKAHMGFNTTQYRRLHSFLLANGVRLLHPTGKMSAHERSMCTDFETGTSTLLCDVEGDESAEAIGKAMGGIL
jgi:hypothetical protein